MNEFWLMGGYGGYVWAAFGVTALVVIYNLLMPIVRHRKLLTGLRNQWNEEHNL